MTGSFSEMLEERRVESVVSGRVFLTSTSKLTD